MSTASLTRMPEVASVLGVRSSITAKTMVRPQWRRGSGDQFPRPGRANG